MRLDLHRRRAGGEARGLLMSDEVPVSELPHLNCTNDEKCKAPVDQHLETCPVEKGLRETFGY